MEKRFPLHVRNFRNYAKRCVKATSYSFSGRTRAQPLARRLSFQAAAPLRTATRAKASRVMFSGLPAVVATLSSIRTPP